MRRVVRSLFTATLLALLLGSSQSTAAQPTDRPSGWIGIYLGGQDSQAVDSEDPTVERGVRVRAVVEGSPAETARLRASDRILAVDGVAVTSDAEVMERVRGLAPDSTVSLTLLRGKEEIDRLLKIGARPASIESLRPIEGWIGIEAIALPPSLREHFGAPDTAGILVSAVAEGSPAEAAGIRIGDVVYEIAGEPVTSVGALSSRLTEAGVDNPVEIVLARDGARIVIAPEIARRP